MKSTVPLIAIALSLTGCAVEDNYRLAVGDSVPLQALPPVVADERTGMIGSSDHDAIPGDGPSIVGLDRGNFEPVQFLVPIDKTYHHPHYTLPITTLDSQARQRGEFPTHESVLEQNEPSALETLYEYVAVPAWSIVEFAWMVPSLVFNGPWTTTSSPDEITGRTSSATTMLVPGVVTLTQAELNDLNTAQSDEQRMIDDE